MNVLTIWLRERTLAERLLILAIANLLLIACAQIRIPLPFTPVPITGQTFGVLLTGALPVFAMLFGPTGGYILVALTIIAFALGNVIIYAFGLPFLFGDLLKIESELTGYHP